MDFDTLGEIIATRRLHYVDEQHVTRTISVLVGKPQPSSQASSYSCAYQIIGVGNQETNLVNGNDAIQALQSAIDLINANLIELNDELGGLLFQDEHGSKELEFGEPHDPQNTSLAG